jgi:hypothetical protein
MSNDGDEYFHLFRNDSLKSIQSPQGVVARFMNRNARWPKKVKLRVSPVASAVSFSNLFNFFDRFRLTMERDPVRAFDEELSEQ